jgi:putative ABC transport system substrate-binding protein
MMSLTPRRSRRSIPPIGTWLMPRVLVTLLVLVALLTMPLDVEAQGAAKIPRIGVLRIGSPTDAEADTFRQALHELGYTEGQNIVIEYRWAEGRLNRLPDLAADLVRLKMDVIVAGGVAGVRAVKQATSTIPIVMEATTDPLGAGLIVSLARPGGNVTGSATLESELGAKRLELFKEAFPNTSRMAVLYDPTTSPSVLREVEGAGERLTIRLHVLKARVPEDLHGAFGEAKKWHAAAVSVLASPFFLSQRDRIASLAVEHRLPAVVPHRAYTEAGGLMSYGPDFRDLRRRAAVFVDKILKGAKPGDLPVEQPTKFELVINLKTAKVLGLTIPPSVLGRADQIIE